MVRKCGTCIKVKPSVKKGKKTYEAEATRKPFKKHKVFKQKPTREKKPPIISPFCNYRMNPEAVENKLRPMANQRKKDTEFTPEELQQIKMWFPKESNYSLFLKTLKKRMNKK